MGELSSVKMNRKRNGLASQAKTHVQKSIVAVEDQKKLTNY
jgi:hypothetical protein